MEMPYRCTNMICSTDPAGRLIFDFWSTVPQCPKCGHRVTVIALETIHFDPPTDIIGKGKNYLACNAKRSVYGMRASGCSAAVNCKACRAIPEWQKANAENSEVE